jgi:hypothetical protein
LSARVQEPVEDAHAEARSVDRRPLVDAVEGRLVVEALGSSSGAKP